MDSELWSRIKAHDEFWRARRTTGVTMDSLPLDSRELGNAIRELRNGRSWSQSSPGQSAALLESRTRPLELTRVGWQYRLQMK